MMKPHFSRHIPRTLPGNPRSGGFALIVTLSLMILLVILAVGLLSLSGVALRSSSQGKAQAEAQANARMALMLAIGQLQLELGPDQRINAPADLTGSGLGDDRRRWVGTWESWPAGQNQRPQPQFRSWLVSGNPTSLENPDFPGVASDLVPLVRGNGSVFLAAPKVELENGGYAYGIVDENAKARLGPALNGDRQDLADHLSRYQSPPAGHGALPGLDTLARDDPRFGQLISTRTVDLVSAAKTQPTGQPESYSVWAEGLLTDVRNGGFRKDLSLYFHDPASGDNTKALYEHNYRRGINFRELRVFHEVSSRLSYDASGHTHPDGGPLNRDVPFLVGSATKATAAFDPSFAYLRPVVIRGAWHISAFTRKEGTDADPLYRIHVVLEPIVWLWNPFDANLVFRPGGHLTVRCWGIPYDVTIKAGATTKTTHFNRIRGNQSSSISMEIGRTSPVVMRPGEVLIFSRGREATTPTNQFARFEGKLGWSGSGGFSLDTGVVVSGSTPVTLSMKSSPTRGAGGLGLVEFINYVGTDNPGDYWNGGLLIDRMSWQGAIAATDFPVQMFQEVPEKTFSSASNLTTPQPLAIFSYLVRTEREGTLRSRYLARLNPGAMSYDHQATDPNTLQSLPYEPVMQPLSGGLDRSIDSDDGKGFFGASYKADVGQSHLVTYSVPRERPISLGAFQHAIANGVEKWIYAGATANADFHNRILQPSVTHAIGNSFAPPCIPPDATYGTFNAMEAVDHSWLANDALWDQWFVSSLAERAAPHHPADQAGTARVLFERLIGKNGEAKLLPNRHLRYAGDAPDADVEALFDGDVPKQDAYLKVASLLRVHGAFNVNSTDRAAWLAMFRSSHGLKVPVEPAAENKSDWEEAENPIAALLIPKGSAVETKDLAGPSNENQWTGYRDPTDGELVELADAMVEEVKKRGPFLCLADFVNRRIVTYPELASRGALQAALDRSLNKSLEVGVRSAGAGSPQLAFSEADQGSQMTHVPGHVKQGDILTTLGSRLTARSDTFTIRAYGEARSPSGELLATARCEAVVQRNPEYVDPADESDILPGDLTREANKRFGRRFAVVSFRWLTPLES